MLTIGTDLLSSSINHLIAGDQALIITDETVASHHLTTLQNSLTIQQCDTLILPPGEQHKSLDAYQAAINTLINKKHHRDTTIITLGGGVITDLGALIASTYQRGTHLLHIPTTLLAQCDACIGGKTAINFSGAKNIIGTFYDANHIIIDIDFLSTLPDQLFFEGMSEAIKIALVMDAAFFDWISQHVTLIKQRDPKTLLTLVTTATELKTRLVAKDKQDHGIRHLLNFGHTIGHALETATDYSHFLHGEAVAIGMVAACKLSEEHAGLSANTTEKLTALLSQFNLPSRLPAGSLAQKFNNSLSHDKKIEKHLLKMVLLESVGTAALFSGQMEAEDWQACMTLTFTPQVKDPNK